MYRYLLLCVLLAVAGCVTADDAVKNYVRQARSPYTYGEDNHGNHGGHEHGHGHGDNGGQLSGFSSGQSNFEPGQASGFSSGRNNQPLLGQDGHGQLGYHGQDHGGHGHGHGHGNDNYLYKKHGY